MATAAAVRKAVKPRTRHSLRGILAGLLASSTVTAVAKATTLVTCPLGKGWPQEVPPMRGLSTSSVMAVARATDMATNAASLYRCRRIHTSTRTAAIATTGIGAPGQISTASSRGWPPRMASTLASTAVSTQPVSIPCLIHTPCAAITSTQTTTIATAKGRTAVGSSDLAVGCPESFNASPRVLLPCMARLAPQMARQAGVVQPWAGHCCGCTLSRPRCSGVY